MAPPVAPDIPWLPVPSLHAGIGGSSAAASLPPPPPGSPQHCALVGPLSLLVQALMLVLVLMSLVVKRALEHPKRPWRIFMLDASKQGFGQAFVHLANLVISSLPASAPPRGGHGQVETASLLAPGLMEPAPPEDVNPCSLYFLNVLIDCTLGVVLIWAVLRTAKYILVDQLKLEGWRMGVYNRPEDGTRVRLDWWVKQAALYVASLVFMKGAVLVIFALVPRVFTFGSWMLDWLNPHAQVIFVMALFPLAMNILQFTLIDSVLKYSAASSISYSATPLHSPRAAAYAALPTTHTSPPPSPPGASRPLSRQRSFTILASARSPGPGSPRAPVSPRPSAGRRAESNTAFGDGDAWDREWDALRSPPLEPRGGVDEEEKLEDEEQGLGLDISGRKVGGS